MVGFDEQVIVISGVARGQGRSHALRLASEGATIVGFDICETFKFTDTPGATLEDLEETRQLVEAAGGRIRVSQADARDLQAMEKLAEETYKTFGRVDSLVVNHGLWTVDRSSWEVSEESWQESIDVLLTGAWKVAKAFVPKIIAGGRGGSVVFTSSANAFVAQPGGVAYSAAKVGVTMLSQVLAYEAGPYDIRFNTVAPGAVDTLMLKGGNREKSAANYPDFFGGRPRARLPQALLQPSAISDAVRWLLSDESRYVTGTTVRVDSGYTIG